MSGGQIDARLYLLSRITDELAAADELRDRYVRRARSAGASWRRIGEATGYSEMGARRRWLDGAAG
jgi:hypothetical protein